MSATLAAHADQFRKQAEWCTALGSPFTAALLNGLADTIGSGTALDRLLAPFAEASPAAATPLRVAGALHALVRTGRDAALAALYPTESPDGDMAAVVPAALAALQRHEAWTAAFLKTAPQTNETRRAIALLPGFARLAAHGPLHLLEIGASAGLNQHWDAFGYEAANWSRAGAAGAPVMTTDWEGPAPELPAGFDIASRRACDLAPLDIADSDARLRLRAYIWPDQADRLARLDAAIDIALARGVKVERANAADWLEAALAGPLPEGTSVVYHSIAWQYFDAETRARAEAAIRAAGARADAAHRLAWLRFEHEKLFSREGGGYRVDLVDWPGEAHAHLADADPHARWVTLV